ncbi:MAG: hypothetical protein IT378_21680, partial [Sandaracinaceae bacterium]|nr:hypothetical protein [Sandaracinaceae bacterium]
TLPRTRPRWEIFDNRPHRTDLATHLSVEPAPWLRIGGGIAFLSYSSNELFIRGDIDIARPEPASRLEHQLTGELFAIRYPQVGIQIQPIPELDIGLVYRGEFALDNVLTAQVGLPNRTPDCSGVDEACLLLGQPIPGFFFIESQSVNAYVPHQLSLGASWQVIPELRISAEVTYLFWSAYISPIGRLKAVLEVDLPPGLEGVLNIPPIPESLPIPANFSDRIVPRIGVEVTPIHNDDFMLRVRGGYFYENSPVPPQTGPSNLVDTDRHAWSAGVGLRLLNLRPTLPGYLAFDAHFQYALLPSRTMIKTSPIDPIGDYSAWGHIFAFGITSEVVFE